MRITPRANCHIVLVTLAMGRYQVCDCQEESPPSDLFDRPSDLASED